MSCFSDILLSQAQEKNTDWIGLSYYKAMTYMNK